MEILFTRSENASESVCPGCGVHWFDHPFDVVTRDPGYALREVCT